MTDVIVIGGGVVGLSIAYELAGQGVAVKVLEQGAFGREASWAAAGMLPPGNSQYAKTPEARLRAESHRLWPNLCAQLFEETGIDNGYRPTGSIEVRVGGAATQLQEEIDTWRTEGVAVEELTSELLFECEPGLTRSTTAAYRLAELSQIRSSRHMKALVAGCVARGVELISGKPVVGFDLSETKAVSVRLPGETHRAGQFCITAGAWSQPLLSEFGVETTVEPVRGQIILLATDSPSIQHIIQDGPRYLVPRPDGRVLVGSTEEWVGFDKENTVDAICELTRFAIDLVPSLAKARFERAWSGLRPGSSDGLAYLGQVPSVENVFVAAGHFRAGLQLSPGTALLVSQLMLGQELSMPLEAFAVDRHQSTSSTNPTFR